MFRVVFLFCLLCLLAACAPLEIYYKPGVTVTRMQSDELACEVASLKDAPVATEIRRSAPIFIPARRYCHGSGQCYYRGGYFLPGEVYSFDRNADLRNRLETQCMAKKGYERVEIKNCQGTESQNAAPSPADVLPTLSENSCVIRDGDGGWQIISPNG